MAINDKNCYIKGFLTGQALKLRQTGASSGGSAIVGQPEYDKASFLSGMAAGFASAGQHLDRGEPPTEMAVLVKDRLWFGYSGNYLTEVDLGNGQTDIIQNTTITSDYPGNHRGTYSYTYPEPGLYVAKIKKCIGVGWGWQYGSTRIRFNSDLIKVISAFPVVNGDSLPGRANGLVNTSAEDKFDGCSNLESIPSDLFLYTGNVTAWEGDFIFRNCTSLKKIPPRLFKGRKEYQSHGTWVYPFRTMRTFRETFRGCTSLTSIPAGLFDECIYVRYNVTSANYHGFEGCFRGCTGITSIPLGLFDACPNAGNFSYCFYGCTSLTGEAPPLWERSDTIGTRCFYNCTGLSNYASIPDDWK